MTGDLIPSAEQLTAARDVLLALSRLPEPWPTNDPLVAELIRLAGRVVQRDRKQQRSDTKQRDADVRNQVEIRGAAPAPNPLLSAPITCYVCKQQFAKLHHFYDSLCPTCAELNFTKRFQTADLRGRTALVTGGRIKSGYHAVLKLLRAGASVVATTRFPKDAARRFAVEPDASEWSERLHLVGLDLRVVPAVERFAEALAKRFAHLDIFVSNAAQTVRRPPTYYRGLVATEREPLAALPALAHAFLRHEGEFTALVPADAPASNWAAELALAPLAPEDGSGGDAFPPGALAIDGEPLDLRSENSWGLSQEAVGTVELLEVHAINCLAPFLLLRALRPLFRAGPPRDRFAVMVSAVEGQFAGGKSGRHPHTNMAKAALNMLVRTSAPECAADRVFLTAVDPGWFSVQQAAPAAERFAASGGRVPLDAVDAAARILDPVFTGVSGSAPAFGVLFKDYREVPW